MRNRFLYDILPGILLSVVLIGTISFFYYKANKGYEQSYNRLQDIQTRLQVLESIYSSMMEAETGQRGYLLSGNEIYLETYTPAPGKVQKYIDELAMRHELDGTPTFKLDSLTALVEKSFATMNFGIGYIHRGDQPGAISWVKAGRGRRVMLEIRDLINQKKTYETGLLNQQYAQIQKASRVNFAAILTVVFLTIGVLAFWAWKLLRNNRKLFAQYETIASTQQELSTSNEQLRLTSAELETINNNLEQIIEERSRALYESEERLEFLADFMPQLVWRTEPNGDHDYFNKRWYEYTGLTYDETKDKGWSLVLHPDDYERTVQVWQHSLDTGEPYEIEYRFRRHDGEYRWFLGRALPIRDEKGNVLKWFGTLTDIEDQKAAKAELEHKVAERTHELLKTNDDLKRSNQELEQFAYVASHDLQEPLRKIQAFGDRLMTKYFDALAGDGADYIQRMQNAAARMQVLINDLLNFSRASRIQNKFEKIDLNQMLKETMSNLEETMTQTGAKIEVGKLPTIKGDPRQIGQMFQNFISNSLKFHKPDVPPHVTINSRAATAEQLIENGIASTKPHYLISIADNGIGFEKKHADRIFTIFQRLHGRTEYPGTGIGLAICRKVVENHQGKILVDSTLDVGTTFTLLLPAEPMLVGAVV